MTYKHIVSSFAGSTSAHGVPKAVNGQSRKSRAQWWVVIGICLVVFLVQMVDVVQLYLKYEISTQVQLGHQTLPFPAVTVCNLNPFRMSMLREVPELAALLAAFDSAAGGGSSSKRRRRSDVFSVGAGENSTAFSNSVDGNLQELKRNKRIVCGSPFEQVGSMCYVASDELSTEEEKQSDADAVCSSYDARLAVLISESETNALKTWINNNNYNRMWTALKYNSVNNELRWHLPGTEQLLVAYGGRERIRLDSNEKCYFLDKDTLKENDCTNNNNFLCQKEPLPAYDECPVGSTPVNNYCYSIMAHSQQGDFSEIQSLCIAGGGRMPVIRNQAENIAFGDYLISSGLSEKVYIALVKINGVKYWKMNGVTEADPITYDATDPSLIGSKYCYKSVYTTYEWTDCTYSRPIVCQFDRAETTTTSAPATTTTTIPVATTTTLLPQTTSTTTVQAAATTTITQVPTTTSTAAAPTTTSTTPSPTTTSTTPSPTTTSTTPSPTTTSTIPSPTTTSTIPSPTTTSTTPSPTVTSTTPSPTTTSTTPSPTTTSTTPSPTTTSTTPSPTTTSTTPSPTTTTTKSPVTTSTTAGPTITSTTSAFITTSTTTAQTTITAVQTTTTNTAAVVASTSAAPVAAQTTDYCVQLSKLNHGTGPTYSNSDRPIGTTALFTCESGMVLTGNFIITCNPGGVWSSSLPACKAQCSTISLDASLHISTSYSDPSYLQSSTATFSCDDDSPTTPYILVPTTSTCLEDGTWSLPLPSQCISMSQQTEEDMNSAISVFAEVANDSMALQQTVTDTMAYFSAGLSKEQVTQLGYQFEELVVNCRYAGARCKDGDFQYLYDPTFSNCYSFNNQDPPSYTTSRAGANEGLLVELYVNQSDYMSTTERGGAMIVIHDQQETVVADTMGYTVPMGYLTSFGVMLTRVERLGAPYGDCVKDESHEKLFYFSTKYSIEGCYRSCYQKNLIDKCSCGDPRLPIPEGGKYCSVKERTCVQNFVVDKTALDRLLESCDCPMPCSTAIYKIVQTNAKWPAKSAMPRQCRTGDEVEQLRCYNKFRKDYGRVEIYFVQMNYKMLAESPAFTFTQLLSASGGNLGLFVGVSAITFMEVGHLISALVAYATCKKMLY